MAIRKVVKIETMLDKHDIDIINDHVHPIIVHIMDEHMSNFVNRNYDLVTCSFADVFDWISILAELDSGEIKTLESLTERVGNLDTAARYPFWDAIEKIEIEDGYTHYT
jgi:hypothetical protein